MRDAYYYSQATAVPDGPEVSILILLIIIAFIVAIVWLVNYEPTKGGKKDLRTEIDKIFSDLRSNAVTFDRPELVPSLEIARTKVLKAVEETT